MRKHFQKISSILINSLILAFFLTLMGCGMSGLHMMGSGEMNQNTPDITVENNGGDHTGEPPPGPSSTGPSGAAMPDEDSAKVLAGPGGAAAPVVGSGGGGYIIPFTGLGSGSVVDTGDGGITAAPLCPPPCSGVDTKSSIADREHILEPPPLSGAALVNAAATPVFH